LLITRHECFNALAGKEIFMKRVFLMVLTLGILGCALAGCHAEGSVGDTAASVGAPR